MQAIVKHKNYLAHDETGRCLVGDMVRLERTPPFNEHKQHAIAETVKPADRYVDPKTKFVYTNGHLKIPVGYVKEDGQIINRIPREMYMQMGLL